MMNMQFRDVIPLMLIAFSLGSLATTAIYALMGMFSRHKEDPRPSVFYVYPPVPPGKITLVFIPETGELKEVREIECQAEGE